MRDRDQRYVPSKLVSERCLYNRIRLVINSRRRFIEYKQFATAHYRTRERQDLPLADREVAPATCDLAIKRETAIILVIGL